MRRICSLIGMPVVCRRRKIGRLVYASLSPDLKQLDGIWVDCGLRGTRYISAEHLSMIGEMAVLSDNAGIRRRYSAAPLFFRAVSTDGSRIGAVTGAEIDEISFLVQALEISRGVWDDFYTGRVRSEAYTVKFEHGETIVVNSAQECNKED